MKTINSEIAEKLREMRLPVFASEFERQCLEPSDQEDSFEVRLKRLVDMEYDSRTNNTIQKNIKMAKFYDSNANINDVDYRPERNIDRGTIESLSTNEYVKNGLNIIIVGASGCGKTWLGCAFGVHACMEKYKARYIRMPELLSEFEAVRIQGRYRDYLKQISKIDLLIIDEFLLILCSQWTPEGWLEKLGNGPVAEAILDRIINSSYKIFLQGKSMREEYSKLKK